MDGKRLAAIQNRIKGLPIFHEEIIERVAASDFFEDVNVGAVEHLFEACKVLNISAGNVLLSPGDRGGNLYIVLQGELQIHLGSLDSEAHVIVPEGECVGELSILDGHPVSAYVVASPEEEVTSLFVIPDLVCWSLINHSHEIACNLLKMLAARMRNANLALLYSTENTGEAK